MGKKRRDKKKPTKKQKKQLKMQQTSPLCDTPSQAVDEAPWHEGLNPKQRLALEHYVTNGFDRSKAVIAAGYSDKNPRQTAHQLFTNIDVRTALAKLLESQFMSIEELRARISDDARATLEPFITVEHGWPSVDWAAAEQAGALKYLREFTVAPGKYGSKVTFKLVDDQKAKDQLIKILGLEVKRLEMTGKGGGPIKTETRPASSYTDEELAKMSPEELAMAWKGVVEDGEQ